VTEFVEKAERAIELLKKDSPRFTDVPPSIFKAHIDILDFTKQFLQEALALRVQKEVLELKMAKVQSEIEAGGNEIDAGGR